MSSRLTRHPVMGYLAFGMFTFLAVAGCGQKSSTAVTSFGASVPAWNQSHTPASKLPAGSAYDADARVPGGERYTSVRRRDGHVTSYTFHFAAARIGRAQHEILTTQFPTGAKILWSVAKPTCDEMMVQSSTLAAALSGKAGADRSGTVLVQFGYGAAEDGFEHSLISQANLRALRRSSPSGAPGC